MSNTIAVNDKYVEELLDSGEYHVDPQGRVWTNRSVNGWTLKDRWRISGSTHKYKSSLTAYIRIRFNKKLIKAHRIVYAALIGKLDPNKSIDHIDGNGLNNHPSNLRLVTHAQNTQFALDRLGAMAGNAKLNQEKVEYIREQVRNGVTQKKMARLFGVSKGTISDIINEKIWIKPLRLPYHLREED